MWHPTLFTIWLSLVLSTLAIPTPVNHNATFADISRRFVEHVDIEHLWQMFMKDLAALPAVDNEETKGPAEAQANYGPHYRTSDMPFNALQIPLIHEMLGDPDSSTSLTPKEFPLSKDDIGTTLYRDARVSYFEDSDVNFNAFSNGVYHNIVGTNTIIAVAAERPMSKFSRYEYQPNSYQMELRWSTAAWNQYQKLWNSLWRLQFPAGSSKVLSAIFCINMWHSDGASVATRPMDETAQALEEIFQDEMEKQRVGGGEGMHEPLAYENLVVGYTEWTKFSHVLKTIHAVETVMLCWEQHKMLRKFPARIRARKQKSDGVWWWNMKIELHHFDRNTVLNVLG